MTARWWWPGSRDGRRTAPRRKPPIEHVAARARSGSRQAAAVLHHRLHRQVHRFAFVLVGDAAVAGHLARTAIDEAIRGREPGPFVAAALRAVQRLAADYRMGAAAHTFEEGVERTVVLLVDDEGLTALETGEVLGMPPAEVERHLRYGRRRLGVDDRTSACSGWSLVRRMDELTAAEAMAARRHLALCRRCEEAHEAREAARARLRLLAPAGGAAGGGGAAWGVLSWLSGSVPAGLGAAAGAAVVAGGLAAPLLLGPHGHDGAPPAGDRRETVEQVGAWSVTGAARAAGMASNRPAAAAGTAAGTASAPAGSVTPPAGATSGAGGSGPGLPGTGSGSGPGSPGGSSGPGSSDGPGGPGASGDPVGTVVGTVGGVVGGVVGTVTSAAPLPLPSASTSGSPLPTVSIGPLPTLTASLPGTDLPTVSLTTLPGVSVTLSAPCVPLLGKPCP